MLGVAGMKGECMKCLERDGLGERANLVVYRVDVIVGVDIYILSLAALRKRGEEIEVSYEEYDQHAG